MISKESRTNMKRVPIDTGLRAQLVALQGTKPLYQFAKVLGLSMQTVAIALAGGNVQAGTRALLQMRIKELTQHGAEVVEAAA